MMQRILHNSFLNMIFAILLFAISCKGSNSQETKVLTNSKVVASDEQIQVVGDRKTNETVIFTQDDLIERGWVILEEDLDESTPAEEPGQLNLLAPSRTNSSNNKTNDLKQQDQSQDRMVSDPDTDTIATNQSTSTISPTSTTSTTRDRTTPSIDSLIAEMPQSRRANPSDTLKVGDLVVLTSEPGKQAFALMRQSDTGIQLMKLFHGIIGNIPATQVVAEMQVGPNSQLNSQFSTTQSIKELTETLQPGQTVQISN